MLKNINDYLSFVVLLVINVAAFSYCLGAFFSGEHSGSLHTNIEAFLNYDDNEDE